MRFQIKLLVILILVDLILISGCNQERLNCIKSDGQWKGFSNSCVDSCDYERGISEMCSPKGTLSCDCGLDMCWNGVKCESN